MSLGSLPRPASLTLIASIVISFLAASSAPTPLYATYQAEWHFTALTTTTVFGVYAIAVLLALLVFGRLSDHVGRRPVLIVSVLVQMAAVAVFLTADGTVALFVARIVQGLATGTATGALGAAMIDVDRERGTTLNAVAPPIGTASGALVSGVLVQLLPAPTVTVYVVLLAVLLVQLVLLAFLPESVSRRRGALRTLVPEVAVPAHLRVAVLTAAPVLVAVWSLAGLYGALGPALVTTLLGHGSPLLGGLAFAVLAGSAVPAVLATRGLPVARAMPLGIAALSLGVLVTVAGVEAGSQVLFWVGTVVAGFGFGTGLQSAITSAVSGARPHERAGVLSVVYVVSYFAMGVPAVIGGVLVVFGGGLLATTAEYGAGVVVLSLLALVGLAVQTRAHRPAARHAAEPCAVREAAREWA